MTEVPCLSRAEAIALARAADEGRVQHPHDLSIRPAAEQSY